MHATKNSIKGRWGKKSKRAVSPIIATILLVAITVVLAAVLYILISGLTKGPGSTPLGTSLSVSTEVEASAGANYYYNTSVQTATSGMTWSNMIFQVQSAQGGVLTTGPTSITTTSASGSCNAAKYTFSSATWGAPAAPLCTTTGGSYLVASGEQIQLVSSVNLASSGDRLVAIGQGSFSGSVVINIP